MNERIGPGPAAYGTPSSFGDTSCQAYEKAPVIGAFPCMLAHTLVTHLTHSALQ